MQQGNKAVTIVIVVALVLAGAGVAAFLFMSNKSAAPQASDETETTTTTEPSSNNATTEADTVTITYTNNGFSPASLTVKAGTTVKIVNDSSNPLQFSSDNHPTHTKNTELNLSTTEPGGSTTFTPSKTGTWGFHNHLNASDMGTLTVE